MNKLGVVVALLACSAAHADEWTGPDKTKHFAGGALIGAAVTAAARDERWGVAAGCAVGAVKEAYDARNREQHTPSFKDFAVTCAGAYLGSKGTGWVLTRTGVMFVKTF